MGFGPEWCFDFAGKNGNGRAKEQAHIRRRLKAAALGVGIEPAPRVHDLRHTFGTLLAENGVDPKTIMELMGHASVDMVMAYIHTNEEKKRDAVLSLE